MKKNDRILAIWAVSVLLLIFCFKRIPLLNAFYSETLYPFLARILNGFSSLFSFSLFDLLVIVALIAIIREVVRLFQKGRRGKAIRHLVVWGIALYGSFYLLWGINYFTPGFYGRNRMETAAYDSVRFTRFVSGYIDALNASYRDTVRLDSLESQVAEGYGKLSRHFVLNPVPASHRNKPMLLGSLYASMGIKGYYTPFLSETHYNPKLLAHQMPFTVAHETAHLIGITNEAEANLYGYLVCVESPNPDFRYSGYLSILPYVLGNARGTLSEEDYGRLVASLDERVKRDYRECALYWDSLYSPTLGSVQRFFYEMYLKGNNIASGTRNYWEVIGLLQSVDTSGRVPVY